MAIDRRRFLQMLGFGAAGVALEQAIPLNRVWFLPRRIILPGQLLVPANASLRIIKAYDIRMGRTMLRFDLAGMWFKPLTIPQNCIGSTLWSSETKVISRDRMPEVPEDLWTAACAYFREDPLRDDE